MERDLCADTLRVAADTVGGKKNLARRLGVEAEELALWISGHRTAPLEHFAAALDIIGERPYLKGAGASEAWS
jgi:hypothetical protein